MIQFETVKYGILKPKDNQRNIKGEQILKTFYFQMCGHFFKLCFYKYFVNISVGDGK